jgi:hypothetical protein
MPHFFRIFSRALLVGSIFILIPFTSDASQSRRTLRRTEDFVVLTGYDAKGLQGAEIADLHMYACRGQSCSPIPFQVDKVDISGRYVFPRDRYRDPDRDGTMLDANDEMCFMAEDAGDRMGISWAPEGAQKGLEIELRDPLDGTRAWVYLFARPGEDPPETRDYVDYRIEGDEIIISSSRFTLGYQTGRVDYDLMQMQNASDTMGPDVLDRQRVGMMARLAKHNMRINVPESIIKTVDVASIDGPVRVIIQQMIVIYLVDISFQYGSEYFMRYYRCGQNNSVFFSFPSGLNKLFNSLVFYWSLDFNPEIIGARYVDPHHPNPLPIKKDIVKAVPNDKAHFWWGLYGKKGALLEALDLDDDMLPYFSCHGLWRQDPEAKDRKGDHPGRIELGLACREIGSLPEKRDFHWLNYILFPAEHSLAGINAVRKIFEHPLQIETEEIFRQDTINIQ